MNIKSIIVLAFLILSATTTHAGPNKSIGIIIGDPIGLSFKYWMNSGFLKGDDHAIDTAVGWNLINNVSFEIKTDYTVHQYGLIPVEVGKLPLYYGIGARANVGGKNNLSVRIPVGVNYLFEGEPFDAFLEAAPLFIIYPATDLSLSLGTGFRYRFR
jgi:hypothetical protein